MKKIFAILLACLLAGNLPAQEKALVFRNEKRPIDERVNDLLKRLRLEEKIALLGFETKPVTRLNIPQYNWWSEALHGVARSGEATVFPQAIGMAASFNEPLLKEVATVISTEARAKYNFAVKNNQRLMYMGLTFWSPNINIFRDPRWGRGQETYGEDPFLTATMGTAFVKGMQGNDPLHLKTAACAKHFAVHSGPEKDRHGMDVSIDEKNLRETYLYAFKKLVDAGVESVMTAYNSVNGEPCSINKHLVQDLLMKEWNFKGHIVTDCGALYDIFQFHKTYKERSMVAAEAIKNGISVDCSDLLQSDAQNAVTQNLVSEKDIDKVLASSLRTQIKLGFFDPGNRYATYGKDSVSNAYHTDLSRKMAQQSIVLLKNKNSILPLDKRKYPAYMILGPNAASLEALMGNYHGISHQTVTFVQGISNAVGLNGKVDYQYGCDFKDTTHFGGIWAAGNAAISIVVLGLTPLYEGEEGDAFLSENGADRLDLSLPRSQIKYLEQLRAKTRSPIVVIITGGSALDIAAIEPYADAILLAWYPGQQGGNAVADILFGKVSPSGRLPVTFYKSVNDLPDYKNYDMKGRTYRYFNGAVQYPFGFGLSYSSFSYAWKQPPAITGNKINFSVSIKNTGRFNADEVVQAYVYYPPQEGMPLKELKAFSRLSLKINAAGVASLSIPVDELKKWDSNGWKIFPGEYKIVIGSNAVDEKLTATIRL